MSSFQYVESFDYNELPPLFLRSDLPLKNKMDDGKLFSKFLVAVHQMKFEKDAEISVDFINKSLFEEKLAADGRSSRFVLSRRAALA